MNELALFYGRKITVAGISKRGSETALEISEKLSEKGLAVKCYSRSNLKGCNTYIGSTQNFVLSEVRKSDVLVLVMSLGGAVRIIEKASILKEEGIAVIVVDDYGRYAIPIVNGHSGSANVFARLISELIGSEYIITDAVELNGLMSVEEMSRRLYCTIANPECVLKINTALANGDPVFARNESSKRKHAFEMIKYPWKTYSRSDDAKIIITDRPGEGGEICYLVPDDISVGIGFTGKADPYNIKKRIEEVLLSLGLGYDDVNCVSSLRYNKFLSELIKDNGTEFRTFSADDLKSVDVSLLSHISEEAEEKLGIPGSAEPSALLSLGPGSRIIYPFTKFDHSMTISVASRRKLFEGKIWFIGVGPSDPSLMTLAAIDRIAKADIVAGYEMPMRIARNAIGKKEQIVLHWKDQQKYVERIIDLYDKGYRIAFLFTGDSCFSESELIRRFIGRCRNYEIIPGISSVQAASARSGMPLELTPVISFHVTGYIEDRKKEMLDSLRRNGRVLVIPRPYDFMPSKIADYLIENGISGSTEVTVMEYLTSENERVTHNTLEQIKHKDFSDISIMAIGNSLLH
ncbi:cobalamin biosynthesis precorrin-6Y methylase [Thermoplasma volcanium GSS1]|uniref:Cobalamin biosynthesis precorrin-6Y methylase n=1 Tax=Thermoplasma volcanium (strain ATCC 51530 / DSM 4299 / JCM 9571 / NBRC 15438 / GSS1) TaxID=273116 RepID=Q97A68_THEVO|nr:precorrin-6y C5,15-methyltransferase (decarboxylating) subunit CbiE [Thermoplasma volcanium]BAB60084.1 cobalamin biosynthesis precorrin-6Y methylase [Thermoplasma volcanium GSS1]